MSVSLGRRVRKPAGGAFEGTAIQWKEVVTAVAITIVSGFVLGCLVGISGFIVYAVVGTSIADAFFGSPIGLLLIYSVVPVPDLLGWYYLCRSVDESRVLNCVAAAVLSQLIGFGIFLFGDNPFEWKILVNWGIHISLAACFGAVWNRWLSFDVPRRQERRRQQ